MPSNNNQYPEISKLSPGAMFQGVQKSGKNTYDVSVEVVAVDMKESNLCGYLTIKGLTTDWPNLVTFFEAEVIGDKYLFNTRKWNADYLIDKQHWSMFPAFKEFSHLLDNEDQNYDFTNSDYLFMRWKERFLVPDHKIKNISGASFAGFYYIVFQKSTGCISGLYYHSNSEMFQQLSLNHVDRHCFSAYAFR